MSREAAHPVWVTLSAKVPKTQELMTAALLDTRASVVRE